jgi:hypothetical protein
MDAEYVLNRLRLEPAPLVGRDIGRLIVNGNPEDLEAIVVRLVDLQYQNNTYGQALYDVLMGYLAGLKQAKHDQVRNIKLDFNT